VPASIDFGLLVEGRLRCEQFHTVVHRDVNPFWLGDDLVAALSRGIDVRQPR
jgi:hypothetical protein